MKKLLAPLAAALVVVLASLGLASLPANGDPAAARDLAAEALHRSMDRAAQPTPVPSVELAAASVTPAQVEQLGHLDPALGMFAAHEGDPWWETLRALTEKLSDAYLDKPHKNALGMTAGEPDAGRMQRLDGFTSGVLDAVRARAGELAQFGPDAAWEYAVTLEWLAHRETRIASNPAKLGDQDQGRAHGYWQIWSWRGGADPYSAATALDMLIAEPEHSWSVPRGHPCRGYPDCQRWLSSHPAPDGP
jgi:hypothetical protein